MEYVQLIGAEDVRSAASTMKQAAEEMRQPASALSDALHIHGRIVEDATLRSEEWMIRFEAAAKMLSGR